MQGRTSFSSGFQTKVLPIYGAALETAIKMALEITDPDISGTRCRNTIFSQNRFGKTEGGKLTGIELSGGTDFKAGDGKKHCNHECAISF